ncbi:hypothetical protein PV325_008643 [Microctonus aethiopoides]|uniref:Transmembrane protein 256 homolog n=1 Tax=Microctonus aethiopoides TaxID=144406 RepID=A0AA39FMJ6_9HYME|nr:hypothetical protein PV325_008643 [Microctonus aethiopoides]KAK0097331.1 hypothetical protein PV326_002416 [Microctonus aethiopoides]KAK0172228.1 hypothetical protein PV328_005573 [Microctonus aethiopoides]
MSVTDALNYIIFTNPVSANAGSIVKSTASTIGYYAGLAAKSECKMVAPEPLWKLASHCGPYMKLAGISGATAVILGAYGAHRDYPDEHLKQVFETANKYHFYHSLAMLSLVLCRTPRLTAALWLSGTMMFSGSCYYYAFTGDKRMSKITPFGGTCFILGWLTLCF